MIQVYLGFHGWKILKAFIPSVSFSLYCLLFSLLAYSYLISRLLNHHLPEPLYRFLHFVGAYWLGAMYYLFLFFLFYDLLYLLLPPIRSTFATRMAGALIVFTVTLLLSYGTYIARSPRITSYHISINKPAPNLEKPTLKIVFVSDLHLGTLIGNSRLEDLVDTIQELQGDIILLGGDVLDEDLGPFVKQNMMATLARLSPPLGVYAIPGNHEYIGRHLTEFSEYLKSAGVQILIDQKVVLKDSLVLIGRDDLAAERFIGRKRLPLPELLSNVDTSLPIILLDHQPFRLEEAEQAGVDLQLSGHTHRGQLWPNHLITRKVYELDYGYKQRGNTHIIVSSGFGTWGPPIRLGSNSEIVVIEITFSK
ncbi:MAG: metallophosphoesterase [Spirochaetales bacterium]